MSNTANETILAAVITRLSTLGEIKTRINPDLGEGARKSIEIYAEPDWTYGVEIVNYPIEKLIFWIDGVEKSEKEWAEIIDHVFEG